MIGLQPFCNMRNTQYKLALCVVFSAGLGILFAGSAGDSYFLLMRMAVSRPVSIVGSVVSVAMPYIVSFLFITHSKPWLVYLFCGIRIFLFSAIGFALEYAFSGSAWLVRFMMQFPDIFLIPVLIWFSGQRLTGRFRKTALVYCVIFTAIIGMIYYCMISPFLANLIDSYETLEGYATHVGFGRRL